MNDKLKEILRDTWPNLYRPPHDFKPPAMYNVQTWNDSTKTVEYHSAPDAIDYEDAQQVIQEQYPERKIIAVTKTSESMKFSTDAGETVEKPVEN
jgi:hypothetical protein